MTQDLLAGVELGGTKCICVLGTGPGHILAEAAFPTEDPATTLPALHACLAAFRASHGPFRALGIAAFGPLELDRGRAEYGHVLGSSKLAWSGADLVGALAAGLACPVGFETDVNAAALAEGRWGATAGLADHAYITVGTGVGAGLVLGGRPVRGFTHTELGHVLVVQAPGHAWVGACPFHGACVEGIAAGPAIAARTGQNPATLPPTHPVWDEVAEALAQLCHTIVLSAAPRRIVLGGGVMLAQPHLLPRIAAALRQSLAGYGVTDRIETELAPYLVAPALGARAGPLGALAVAALAAAAAVPA